MPILPWLNDHTRALGRLSRQKYEKRWKVNKSEINTHTDTYTSLNQKAVEDQQCGHWRHVNTRSKCDQGQNPILIQNMFNANGTKASRHWKCHLIVTGAVLVRVKKAFTCSVGRAFSSCPCWELLWLLAALHGGVGSFRLSRCNTEGLPLFRLAGCNAS